MTDAQFDPELFDILWAGVPEEDRDKPAHTLIDSRNGIALLCFLENDRKTVRYYPMSWDTAVFTSVLLYERGLQALMHKEELTKEDAMKKAEAYIEDIYRRSAALDRENDEAA